VVAGAGTVAVADGSATGVTLQPATPISVAAVTTTSAASGAGGRARA
jgi:hypothetical protein